MLSLGEIILWKVIEVVIIVKVKKTTTMNKRKTRKENTKIPFQGGDEEEN